jgi:hypothetical protein
MSNKVLFKAFILSDKLTPQISIHLKLLQDTRKVINPCEMQVLNCVKKKNDIN